MRLILTTKLLLITFFAIGQQSNKLEIQPEVGQSLISVHGDFLNTKPSLEGANLGVLLNYNFNKILSIKTGISYERKGFRDTFESILANGQSLGVYRMELNLDYLVVPILARAKFGNKLKFFVNGGPYIGYLTNQLSRGMFPTLPSFKWNFLNKKFDLGVSGGIGVSYPLNDMISISLETRNNSSLISLAEGGSINTNSTNFIFGINYHLKDKNLIKAN